VTFSPPLPHPHPTPTPTPNPTPNPNPNPPANQVRRDAVAHMRREAAFFGAMFEAADFEALT
jgi:hypothetical protein